MKYLGPSPEGTPIIGGETLIDNIGGLCNLTSLLGSLDIELIYSVKPWITKPDVNPISKGVVECKGLRKERVDQGATYFLWIQCILVVTKERIFVNLIQVDGCDEKFGEIFCCFLLFLILQIPDGCNGANLLRAIDQTGNITD